MRHTPVVLSVMVLAPATYHIAGRTIDVEEGTELIFPQYMAHEVRPRGPAQIRRNTTHRVWVPTEAIEFALPKAISTQEEVQTQLDLATRWQVWRFNEKEWIAGRQNQHKAQQAEHFELAMTQLTREQAREGRTIWQCGPKFDYRTSNVKPGTQPTPALKESIIEVLKGMPFKKVVWAHAIYNEYQRQQKQPDAHYKAPAWEGFKGTTHPWIHVNRQRPISGKNGFQDQPPKKHSKHGAESQPQRLERSTMHGGRKQRQSVKSLNKCSVHSGKPIEQCKV